MNTYLRNIEKQYERHISIHRMMLVKSAILGLFSIMSMIVSILASDGNVGVVAFFASLFCVLVTFFAMTEKTPFSVDQFRGIDDEDAAKICVNMEKVRKRMELGKEGEGDIAFTIKHFAMSMIHIEKQCFRMAVCHSFAIGFMIGGYVGMFTSWFVGAL